MKDQKQKIARLNHEIYQLRRANACHKRDKGNLKNDKEQLKARIDEITAYKWSNLTVCAILSFALGVAARTLIQ